MLSSWRAFYRFAAGARPARSSRIRAPGLRPPQSPRRLPSALSPDEAVRLVAIDGDDPLALRDRALFELAYSSGLRLSELAGLDVDRVDLATGEVRVWGKGAKERIVPVGAAAIARDPRLARGRASTLPGVDAEAMFVGAGGRADRAADDRAPARRVGDRSRASRATCIRTCCGTRSPRTCCSRRATCARCRRCSATRRIASTQVYTHLDFQALAKVYDAAHPRARKK